MKMSTVTLDRKVIHGQKIRTNNDDIDQIVELWESALEMELEGDIYAIYSNYESNYEGQFDLLIGNEDVIFDSFSTIDSGQYLVIDIEDQTPEGMADAWEAIWDDPEIESKRAYKTDFEFYGADGSIKIYLSIK